VYLCQVNSIVLKPTDILNGRILIVDDKEVNVRLLEGMLRVAGYTSVQSTMDPNEVCQLHRRNRYGLILLDLNMPGMDGFQVMEGLKAVEEDGYPPVLVITAQPNHKLRALEAGARDFIAKPFDQAELGVRVRNMLEVRLLHLEARNHARALEETVRELEESREIIRLKTLAESKKREQELALAQETQESLLPHSLPCFASYRIHAFNNPTRYVGGDFYDFMQLISGEWMGVLADVSGKGMPAALLSSMVLGALNMEFRAGTEAPEVLNRVNRLLCEKSLGSQFVTLFLFLLNPDGQGSYISAGHNPVCLYRAATGKIEALVSDAAVLGIFDSFVYETHALHLCSGDILVVYSDGLTDAENPHGEMFNEERVQEIILRDAPSGSRAVEQGLLKAIQDFTEGMPQTDDITFVVVEKYN
jgi:serine phosphatase RsbU (regulator of sigma subunit)